MEHLALPRQLVQEILHQAQIAPAGITQGLVVRGADNKLGLAQFPSGATITGAMAGLAAHESTPVAVYRSSMAATEEGSAEELTAWEAPRRCC